MVRSLFAVIVSLASASMLGTSVSAQTISNDLSDVNRQAIIARTGDGAATSKLTRHLFSSVGVPTEIADAFGFSDRITSAEIQYRHGEHQAVQESDVVRAVNNMLSTLGAPQWANTSAPEIRKLRMHMLVLYPQLLISESGTNEQGKREVVSSKLRPMEAAYLAMSMLYQKAFNSEYQFSDAEKADNRKLDATAVGAKHMQRTQELLDLLHGKTRSSSVSDLIASADRMFSDLSIPPTSSASITAGTAKFMASKAKSSHGGGSVVLFAGLGGMCIFALRKRLGKFSLLTLVLVGSGATVVLSGCGGSSGVPYNGIYTQIASAGVTSAWPSAVLWGYTLPGDYNCGNNTCDTEFSATTDSNGFYELQSWAIPGGWEISAKPDSTCAAGASSGGVHLDASGTTTLVCGQVTTANLNLSQGNCYKYVDQSTDSVTTNCPMTIDISADSSVYPTAHAMVIGTYDDTGSSQGSSSLTATSATLATIPTPGFAGPGVIGDNIVVLTDSTSNNVIGAALFNYSLVITSGTCADQRVC